MHMPDSAHARAELSRLGTASATESRDRLSAVPATERLRDFSDLVLFGRLRRSASVAASNS